ncbi:hypothetical protein AJ78_06539 [Emergomyces pasteurianus Ep9510]|uniref:Pyroglutamyl-peptidase I n=1 Tax=Emergomyces pasteurianus Ep9510 TaxID=1447872 RepID=A0A1J9QCP1_9EURO|nr:hypothetical protein AJ78_06539 [Emergomyces pasteurianus Ep9510]
MGDVGPAVSGEPDQLQESIAVIKEYVQDIHVLVTGFGPFKTNPLNPSFLIASALPKIITLPQTSPTSAPRRILIHTHPTPIRVAYSAVRSAVPAIIDAFKNDHDGRPPDFVMHIGMASTRDYYAVETVAHRDDYRITDVDGDVGVDEGEAVWKALGLPEVLRPGPCIMPDDDEGHEGDEGDANAVSRKSSTAVYTTRGISATVVTDTTTTTSNTVTTTTTSTSTTTTTTTTTTKMSSPDEEKVQQQQQEQHEHQQQQQEEKEEHNPIRNTIVTTITSAASQTPTAPYPPDAHFLKTWQSFAPCKADVRLSEDAGRYLCEFIYYTSLAHAYKERSNRSVVFLHVPGRTDDEAIQIGREVAVGLVRCLVACWVV